MAEAGFWTRVGGWLGLVGRDGPDGRELPRLDHEMARRSGASGSASSRSRLSARQARKLALETLQDGYLQLAELAGRIHENLSRQDERTRQLADSVQVLLETVSRLPGAADAQSGQLAAIAAQLSAANDRSRRWEQTLFDLPRLAEGQREALAAISRELESARSTDLQLTGTLDGLRAALTTFGQSCTTSLDAIKALQDAAARREERFNQLLAGQHRRFFWMLAVIAAIGLAAIGLAIAAWLR